MNINYNLIDETPVGHTEMTNKVHVGHNGMTNVPFIGGVVTSSSSMEDYSYRSGDVSFAQAQTKTKKKEPPAPQEVIYDEHGNEIKIARNLSAGRKPRKLRLRRMMEAAQEEARVIARGIQHFCILWTPSTFIIILIYLFYMISLHCRSSSKSSKCIYTTTDNELRQ